MLVLVSFGLVLLATILLVVGLLSDDAINLIYLSIAASATAAVVLFLAFRMARPKGAVGSASPAPLPDDLVPTEDDAVAPVAPAQGGSDVTTTIPATPAAPPTPPPVPAAASPSADDWADDTDWEVDDEVVDFPIADYDDLTVAEILPLLPQLYSDELDIVYEREQGGKARSSILSELDRLKETGTEADALEQAVEEEVAAPPPPAAPTPQPEPTRAPAPTSLLDDEDDDAAFFPIADYDDLSVSQIVPLLPQLELDELRDVREREVAGANRATLVNEIDRYLSGELQAFTWEDETDHAAPVAPVVDPEVERLPIADYPQLIVSEVVAQLDNLTPAQLEHVLEFEKARDNRYGIVADIERRLAEAAPATTTRPRPAPVSAGAPAATPKRTARKTATKKRAPQKAAATKRSAGTTAAKKSTKKTAAKRSTAKKSASRATKAATPAFPIANYDELNVADIRPRLADLTDAQLRQVREREESGAGRKTILTDIDRRLS